MTHNLIEKRLTVPRRMGNFFLNFASGTLQMLSVTSSLIAANIFTPYFQKDSVQNAVIDNSFNGEKNTSFVPSRECPYDFGCDANACWRSCTPKGNGMSVDAWCYTSPVTHYRRHAHCASMMDCSPCWSCIGIRHTPQK